MAQYLYHVTYLFNLPGIARDGLVPGAGQNFGRGWQDIAKGWLFLTESDGVSFWASRLEDHAEANTEHPEEGWAPVVISIAVPKKLALEPDAAGSRDASAQAWRTKDTIPAKALTYWDGEEWSELKGVDASVVDLMLDAWREAGEEQPQDEDDEEGDSWWDLPSGFFLPPDEELIDEDDSPSKNPLEPHAFDTETRPFTARHRPVSREEQVGVHVTSNFDTACVYAMQRASLQGDSIGIVFVLDVSGLEALPDVDAVIQSELHSYAAKELLNNIEDTTDPDSVSAAIDDMREQQEFDGEALPDTWLDGAFQLLDRNMQANLLQVLSTLPEDVLMAEIEHATQDGNFSLDVWAAVVEQWRFMSALGPERLVEVRAIRPVRHDLWGRGPDDPDSREQEYPEADPNGPEIFTENDFAEEHWTPDNVVLWTSERTLASPAFHGTDLVRARRAFPELTLENPWECTQE